jgi:hypothetical protein
MANARNNFTRPYYKAGFTGWFRGLFSESLISHPGTVTGDFKTASVKTAWSVASVTSDFKTASVSTKAMFLVKD